MHNTASQKLGALVTVKLRSPELTLCKLSGHELHHFNSNPAAMQPGECQPPGTAAMRGSSATTALTRVSAPHSSCPSLHRRHMLMLHLEDW